MGIEDHQRIDQREVASDVTQASHCEGGICFPRDPKLELKEMREKQTSSTTLDTARDLYKYSSTDPPGKQQLNSEYRRLESHLPEVILTNGNSGVEKIAGGNRRDLDPGRVMHDAADHAGPGSLRRHRVREEQHNHGEGSVRPYPYSGGQNYSERSAKPSEVVPPDSQRPNADNSGRIPNPLRSDANQSDQVPSLAHRHEEIQPRAGNGRVTEVGPREVRDAIRNASRPVVVEVYMDNCPGCRAIDPQIRNLAAQYNGKADVYRMNVNHLDRDPELRSQLDPRQVPATFIFDHGKMINKEVGVRDAQFFGKQIDRALQKHPQEGHTSSENNRHSKTDNKRNDDHNDLENTKEKHGLSARLERIKEKLHRMTHFREREKEEAFKPTNEEIRTLALINQVRAKNGLGPVVQDPRLQLIARRHTEYQMQHGMTHNESTPGWQNVSQRMQQVGLQGWRENAAIGSFTPEKLVQMWWDSPGHRAALLGQGNIAAVAIRGGSATFNLTNDPEMSRY